MPRPITDTLRLLHGGLFLDTCSDLLAGVVRSVEETGKPGKLTITLDVKKVAGAYPPAYWGPETDATPALRERLKTQAAEGWLTQSRPGTPAFRAPYLVLHAYTHWWRARLALDTWDADEYDETFPSGMDFRRYLGAWLHSVGLPRLGMTATDIEAVHQMTGVAALPHELLPVGFSEFRHQSVAESPPSLGEVIQAATESGA